MIKRIIAITICFCLVFEQAGFAQVVPSLGVPAYLSNLAPVADRFRPVQLRSVEFDPASNNIQLLLDKGDLKVLTSSQTETSSQKLFTYFQIGLALPNSMFWVNLRPDSPEDVIQPDLEKTDLGRILLEADLQLKKDVSRFTNPDTEEGRQYWDKLYAKAEALYGAQDCEIPTLTRPWIVPGEIIIRESGQGAFIYKATLKVMLEQDYLKDSPFYRFDDPKLKEINEYSSELIRQIIIPKLTREVNSSKRYADLRQVYYSLVLAQWLKSRRSSLRGAEATKQSELITRIDQKDLTGLTSKKKWTKHTYYKAYQKSFQQGEYSKEETVNSQYGLTVRQYFSGGVVLDGGSTVINIPASVTDFFVANLDAFTRVTPQSGSMVSASEQQSALSLQKRLFASRAFGLLDAAVSFGAGNSEYILPPLLVLLEGLAYYGTPLLAIALPPALLAAMFIGGSFISAQEFYRMKRYAPEHFAMTRGNPYVIMKGWQALALGLDGIFDMREVGRSPKKFFTNLTRIMVWLPIGLTFVTAELAVDFLNGKRTGQDIIKTKLDVARYALEKSSGIHPAKVLYILFNRWSFAKDDLERKFMLYETIATHAQGSSDLDAPAEDTERNNTFLASESAFYQLIKQLKLEEMEAVIQEMQRRQSTLYKISSIEKEKIRSGDILHRYLSERSRIWRTQMQRGVLVQDKPLVDFLAHQGLWNYAEYAHKPYYAFTVLAIVDRYFHVPFSREQVLGSHAYARWLESPHVFETLQKAGIIEQQGEEYVLREDFKDAFRLFVQQNYREVSGQELAAIPEYEGALYLDGKPFRWKKDKAAAQQDGGTGQQPARDGGYGSVTSLGMNDIFNKEAAVVSSGPFLFETKISAAETAYSFRDQAYIVWTTGPKSGRIYRIIARKALLPVLPIEEFFKEIDTRLQVINSLSEKSKGAEARSALIDLALYVQKMYDGDDKTQGIEYAWLFDETAAYYPLAKEMREKSLSKWLQDRAESKGYAHMDTSLGRLEALEKFYEYYYAKKKSRFNQYRLPRATRGFLLRGTLSDSLVGIVNLGGLASAYAFKKAGIHTIGGEWGVGYHQTPRDVSFWHFPGSLPSITGGFGPKIGVESYPMAWGIVLDAKTSQRLKLEPGTMDKELTSPDFVGLENVTHVFVPHFKIKEVSDILAAFGFGPEKIQVLPLGFDENGRPILPSGNTAFPAKRDFITSQYDGGKEKADERTADFVGSVELQGNRVRVFSPSAEGSHRKTIALVYSSQLEPDKKDGIKLIWARPAEVSGYTPEQRIEIARKVAEASEDAKRKLGINVEDTLEQMTGKYFLVIENALVVVTPGGEIKTGAIGSVKEIKWLIDNETGHAQTPRLPNMRESRIKSALAFTRGVLKENLNERKAMLRAQSGNGEAGLSNKDGGNGEKIQGTRGILETFKRVFFPASVPLEQDPAIQNIDWAFSGTQAERDRWEEFFLKHRVFLVNHIRNRVFSLVQSHVHVETGVPEIRAITVEYKSEGGFKFIFKVRVDFMEGLQLPPVDLGFVMMKPTVDLLAREEFKQELKLKNEYHKKAKEKGADPSLVPQPYDEEVLIADGLPACYLQEWIEGVTLTDKLDQGIGDRETMERESMAAWVSITAVLGVFVKDCHSDNILVRSDNNKFVVVDLGNVAALIQEGNENELIEAIYGANVRDANDIRKKAVLESLFVETRRQLGRKFLDNALSYYEGLKKRSASQEFIYVSFVDFLRASDTSERLFSDKAVTRARDGQADGGAKQLPGGIPARIRRETIMQEFLDAYSKGLIPREWAEQEPLFQDDLLLLTQIERDRETFWRISQDLLIKKSLLLWDVWDLAEKEEFEGENVLVYLPLESYTLAELLVLKEEFEAYRLGAKLSALAHEKLSGFWGKYFADSRHPLARSIAGAAPNMVRLAPAVMIIPSLMITGLGGAFFDVQNTHHQPDLTEEYPDRVVFQAHITGLPDTLFMERFAEEVSNSSAPRIVIIEDEMLEEWNPGQVYYVEVLYLGMFGGSRVDMMRYIFRKLETGYVDIAMIGDPLGIDLDQPLVYPGNLTPIIEAKDQLDAACDQYQGNLSADMQSLNKAMRDEYLAREAEFSARGTEKEEEAKQAHDIAEAAWRQRKERLTSVSAAQENYRKTVGRFASNPDVARYLSQHPQEIRVLVPRHASMLGAHEEAILIDNLQEEVLKGISWYKIIPPPGSTGFDFYEEIFTPEAVRVIHEKSIGIEYEDVIYDAGAYWDGKSVHVPDIAREGYIHEYVHGLYEHWLEKEPGLTDDFIQDMVKLADMDPEDNPEYAAAIEEAQKYVYGAWNKEKPLDREFWENMPNWSEEDWQKSLHWEMFASIHSFTGGYYKEGPRRMPEFMWKYFARVFRDDAPLPYYMVREELLSEQKVLNLVGAFRSLNLREITYAQTYGSLWKEDLNNYDRSRYEHEIEFWYSLSYNETDRRGQHISDLYSREVLAESIAESLIDPADAKSASVAVRELDAQIERLNYGLLTNIDDEWFNARMLEDLESVRQSIAEQEGRRETKAELVKVKKHTGRQDAAIAQQDGGEGAKIGLPATIGEYLELSGQDAEVLRQEFFRRFTVEPVILSDGTSLDPSYALTQDIRMEQLVKASRRLNELEEGKYPDALRVSLGRSPLWFLETARLLKGEKGDYVFAAFSGSWDRLSKGPNKEQVAAYRAYLDRIGLNPAQINKRAQAGQKTILIEFVDSASSLRSFLSILKEYARQEHEEEALQKSLVIHMLQNPGRVIVKDFDGFEVIQQEIGNALLWSLMDEPSMGIKYPHEEWSTIDIEAYPLSNISHDAALIRFRIIDYLAGKDLWPQEDSDIKDTLERSVVQQDGGSVQRNAKKQDDDVHRARTALKEKAIRRIQTLGLIENEQNRLEQIIADYDNEYSSIYRNNGFGDQATIHENLPETIVLVEDMLLLMLSSDKQYALRWARELIAFFAEEVDAKNHGRQDSFRTKVDRDGGKIIFATAEDVQQNLATVLELINSVPKAKKYSEEELLAEVRNPASRMLFNFVDNRLVALIWCYDHTDQAISWDRMATAPSYRRQGRATALLLHLAENIPPGTTIKIPINEANETFNLYERWGFERDPSGQFRVVSARQLTGNRQSLRELFDPILDEESYLQKWDSSQTSVQQDGGSLDQLIRERDGEFYINTKEILPEYLPLDYSTAGGLRQPRAEFRDFPRSIAEIPQPGIRPLLKKGKPVIPVSLSDMGSAHVMFGIAGKDNAPVVLKGYGRDEIKLLRDYKGALIADDLGIGPKIHGLFKDDEGALWLAMDVVPGDFPYSVGNFISTQSVADRIEIQRRLAQNGVFAIDDFQYFVSPSGHVWIIDQISLSETMPEQENASNTDLLLDLTLLIQFSDNSSEESLESARQHLKEAFPSLSEEFERVAEDELGGLYIPRIADPMSGQNRSSLYQAQADGGKIVFAKETDIRADLGTVLKLVNFAPGKKFSRNELLAQLKNPRNRMIFHFFGDNLAALLWYYDNGNNVIDVRRLATAPSYRRQGKATALLLRLAENIPAEATIALRTNAGNPAMRLYEELGFKAYVPGNQLGLATEPLLMIESARLIGNIRQGRLNPSEESPGNGVREQAALTEVKTGQAAVREQETRTKAEEMRRWLEIMPEKYRVFLDTIADKALEIAQNIQKEQYDAVVISGGSAILVYLLIRAAWERISSEPLPIITLSQKENELLYQHGKAESQAIFAQVKEKIPKRQGRELPLVLYIDTHWNTGMKRERLDAFKTGFNMRYAVFTTRENYLGDFGGTSDPMMYRSITRLAAYISERVKNSTAGLSEQRVDQDNTDDFIAALEPREQAFVHHMLGTIQSRGRARGNADGGMGQNDLSGIDFRTLPVGQPQQAPVMMPQIAQQMQKLAKESKMQDLDKEWKDIESQMRSKDMPYNRIKEYIAVCATRTDTRQHLDKTVSCILNILRIEEEQALVTSQELKELLVYIG